MFLRLFEECAWKGVTQVCDQWVKVGPWDPGGIFPILPLLLLLPPPSPNQTPDIQIFFLALRISICSASASSSFWSCLVSAALWFQLYISMWWPLLGRMINSICFSCSAGIWSHLFWDQTLHLAEEDRLECILISIVFPFNWTPVYCIFDCKAFNWCFACRRRKRRYLFPIEHQYVVFAL